jgi:hypothetical protein
MMNLAACRVGFPYLAASEKKHPASAVFKFHTRMGMISATNSLNQIVLLVEQVCISSIFVQYYLIMFAQKGLVV